MVRTGIRTHGPYYLLQNSIHKRNVVEDQPQKLSPLLNLKPHLKPQHSPTLQTHRCLPRMWSLEVKWRIYNSMCTTWSAEHHMPLLQIVFAPAPYRLRPGSKSPTKAAALSAAFIGERLQTLVFPRTPVAVSL